MKICTGLNPVTENYCVYLHDPRKRRIVRWFGRGVLIDIPFVPYWELNPGEFRMSMMKYK